jgi:hypothetical protein
MEAMEMAQTNEASVRVTRYETFIGVDIDRPRHVNLNAATMTTFTWFAEPSDLLKVRNALDEFMAIDRNACHDEALRMAAEMPEPVAEAVAG